MSPLRYHDLDALRAVAMLLGIFLLVCAVTFAILLLIYDKAIRYTWAGALLNGRKYHQSSPPPLPSRSD